MPKRTVCVQFGVGESMLGGEGVCLLGGGGGREGDTCVIWSDNICKKLGSAVQFERVDIPAHAGTAHKGFLQKRLEEDIC